MIYYVDYFDFYLGGRANRLIIKNKILRFKYDILCIKPQNDILVFTLSETMLEDSNRILVEYDEFWQNGIFKIALAKKYKNAKTYISDRMKILNDEERTNFELDIYNSDIAHTFFDEYLEDKLKLKGQKSYILHRTSNADTNNRILFRKRISDMETMYHGMKDIMNYSEINNLIKELSDRSNDGSQVFQRGYIIKDIFQKYPSLHKKSSFLYNLFDQNYNDAMALAVDATRLTTLQSRVNGDVLEKFISSMDPKMYKKINLMTSQQLYSLVNCKSWQRYVDNVNELYFYLWELKKLPKDHNIYKYYKKRVDLITYAYKYLIEIMDRIIGFITIPEPYWRIYYEQLKYNIEMIKESYLLRTNYILYLASDIFAETSLINMLIDDIISGD